MDAKKFEQVVVADGDGTINLVASNVINTDITLGILACGSANGLATSLDFPEKLDQQLEIAITNEGQYIDTLTVNNNICLHIADIGINAELIYNYETANGRGMLGYAKQCVSTLFKSNYPYKFKIVIDNNNVECKGILLAFANAKKYGTGAVINSIGKIKDGIFEVVLYKRLSFRDIVKAFLKRTSKKEPTIDRYSTKSVLVESRKKIALQVDGEFIGKLKKFEAHLNSKNLNMALPNLNQQTS